MRKNKGFGKDLAPKLEFVLIYFDQKGASKQKAEAFFNHFSARKWRGRSGEKITDWKVAAWKWLNLRNKGPFH